MLVDIHGRPIAGLEATINVGGRSWQEQCAHEIYQAQGSGAKIKPLPEADILGHIKRHSDGVFDHLMNSPIQCELRVRTPGTNSFHPIVGNTIKAGSGATTAIRNFKGPIFIEAVMFEAKKV